MSTEHKIETTKEPLSLLLAISLVVSFVLTLLTYNFNFILDVIGAAMISFTLLTIYYYKEEWKSAINVIKEITLEDIGIGILLIIAIILIIIFGITMTMCHVSYNYLKKKNIL